MKKRNGKIVGTIILLIVVALVCLAAGYVLRGLRPAAQTAEVAAVPESPTVWTCSMHPQIRQPKPGQCPICFMDLIPVESSDAGIGQRQISFSPEALKLMEVQTSPVKRKFVEAEIRLVGKIAYDETRIKSITAWVPGRIDRLYVDFTGTVVKKDDHMVELYSPELITAQAEFLQAIASAKTISTSTELVAESIRQTLQSAREKMRLLGLTERQIADIEKASKPLDQLTIYAPIGGVVIEKDATEGMYVNTGMKIYTIADLSQMWVLLDAYESDMTWLRYGQDVTFEAEAFPGKLFHGTISFIDPRLDTRTQTIKLRVNVANENGELRPGMFVSAAVKAKVAEEGKVMAQNLAGKWICPMHPDVVKDAPGTCDICGMALVTTESLGYVPAAAAGQPPLVVPASAVLMTGKRAVVYVQVPETEKPTFEGREIILGPRAGDHYIVREGLGENEIVVTNGNFKIDSALQIQAKPSMMGAAGVAAEEHVQAGPGEQTHCPVMGGKINRDVFVEYEGKKVYFCCPGCEDTFLKEPEKYLSKLPQFNQANQ
ncbi:MAG: efflux RND transporter periplasmic adaptor subunit [Phycisphaerae bacterium]|nr:efflux RND transporter periplasmic adaptor subunit [Phycisphaerae bacterium]